MIRTLGLSLAILGSVCATLPAAEDEESAGASVYLPTVTPERLLKDEGARRVVGAVQVAAEEPADDEPEPAPAPRAVGPAAAPAESVYSPACNPCDCQSGCCRPKHCNTGRCYPPHEPRPCYFNDQYEPEWYIAPMIGFQNAREANFDWQGTKLQIDPDGGPQGGIALGWAGGPTWMGRHRVEAELMFRTNDIDSLRIQNFTFQANGDFTTVSGLVNYYWDFKQPDRDWYPYIGVGVGAAHVAFNNTFAPFGHRELTDNVFAWQAIGGISWRVRSYLEFFAEARHFGTGSPEFVTNVNTAFTAPNGNVIPPGTYNLKGHYNTWGTMFGVRIILGKRRCVDGCASCDGRPTSGGGWKWHPWW